MISLKEMDKILIQIKKTQSFQLKNQRPFTNVKLNPSEGIFTTTATP